MNWDIKEIHNYNEYMQKYSIHSLLAKIFAQRKYNEQDIQVIYFKKIDLS